MENKFCNRCKSLKTIEDFYIRKSGKKIGRPRSYCKLCEYNSCRKWYKDNPQLVAEKQRNYDRKKHYGITPEDYIKMLIEQNYKCANTGCLTDEPGGKGKTKQFHVDHDHKTGKVRGLLCARCNNALGCVGDSELKLFGLIKYLKINKSSSSE